EARPPVTLAANVLRESAAHGPRPGLPRHVRERADGEARPDGAAAPPRWRPPALRLRRGHAAPADALDGRPARPRADLHLALPCRPLPRPARDAEDVRAAPARAAAHRLRTARAARPVQLARARLRQAFLPRRDRRGARGGEPRA